MDNIAQVTSLAAHSRKTQISVKDSAIDSDGNHCREGALPLAQASRPCSAIERQKLSYDAVNRCFKRLDEFRAAGSGAKSELVSGGVSRCALSAELSMLTKVLSGAEHRRLQERLQALANEPLESETMVLINNALCEMAQRPSAHKNTKRGYLGLGVLLLTCIFAAADWQASQGSPAYREAKTALWAKGLAWTNRAKRSFAELID